MQARAGDPAAARATLQRAIAHAKDLRALLAIEQVQAKWGTEMRPSRRCSWPGIPTSSAPSYATIRLRALTARSSPPDPELAARHANRQIPKTLTDVAIEQSRLGDRPAAEATLERRCGPPGPSYRTIGEGPSRKSSRRGRRPGLRRGPEDVASIADRAERFEALTEIGLEDLVDTKVMERILRMIDAEGVPPELPEDSFLSEEWVTGMKTGP